MSLGSYDTASASAEELQLADDAMAEWQTTQKDFIPLMQESATTAMDADKRNDVALNGIAAGIGQTVDAQQAQTNNAMFASGSSPMDGGFMMANTGAQRTAAVSKGISNGIAGNEKNYLAGVGNVLQQGQGLLNSAKQGAVNSAGIATTDQLMKQSAANALSTNIGTAAGAGIGAYASMNNPEDKGKGFTVKDAQVYTQPQTLLPTSASTTNWLKPSQPAWQQQSGGY